MRDTSDRSMDRYYELLCAQTPAARLATAANLSTAVRQLAEAGIRDRDPSATPDVVRARLTARLYGREVAARLFPGIDLNAE